MAKRTCSIDGCEKPMLARGWCGTHYARWRAQNGPVGRPVRQKCTVDGCDRWVHGHGLCHAHWRQKRRTGTLKPIRAQGQTVEERFWSKVEKRGHGGCWIWTAHLNKGYGRFRADGRVQEAHRWAYAHEVGPIPEGLVLDHLCRTPACVNPAHLEPVTILENLERGRRDTAAEQAAS